MAGRKGSTARLTMAQLDTIRQLMAGMLSLLYLTKLLRLVLTVRSTRSLLG